MSVVLLLSGCGRYEGPSDSQGEHGQTSAHPGDSTKWVLSPDSFGPITTEMSKGEILATGAFREAPNACPAGRLDWHSQTYENEDGIKVPSDPQFTSIDLEDGKPLFIDPGPEVQTDTGIGEGDSVTELRAAYPGRVVSDLGMLKTNDENLAVSGKNSHLVFYTRKGKVEFFYLTTGAVTKDNFYADYRGIGC